MLYMYNITYLYRVQKSISIVLQFGPIQIKVANKVHINKLGTGHKATPVLSIFMSVEE